MLLAPLTSEPWHLYLTIGLLVGAGSVCLGYSGQSLFLPNWFVRKRGLAIGIAFAGVGIGSITLLPWMQMLIEQAGWRTACWTLGLLILDRARADQPAAAQAAAGPRDCSPTATPRPRQTPRAPPMSSITPGRRSTGRWRARCARNASGGWRWRYFTGLYGWYAVQIHQTKYLIEIGFSPSTAAWALGFVSLVGIPGQIWLGHLSDRIGREWIWSVGSAGFAICFLALIALQHTPSMPLLYLMVLAQGFLGYGVTSIIGAVAIEIFEGKHFGSIYGTLTLAGLAGGAAGPWITGVIHDQTGSYAARLLDRPRPVRRVDLCDLDGRPAQDPRRRRADAPGEA